jgi:hypothetical protein
MTQDQIEPRLCIGKGRYYTLTDPTKHPERTEYQTTCWSDIVWMVSNPGELQPVDKNDGWWLIASDIIHRRARLGHVQRDEGRFWILIADIDKGNLPLATVGAGVEACLDAGTEYQIYATRSSEPDDKRWKVMVPLGMPCPGRFYHHFAEQFNLHLAKSLGVGMDACTDREHQITYLPNPGKHYEWHHQQGAAFGKAHEDSLAHALVNCARQAEAQRTPWGGHSSIRQKERGYYLEQFAKEFPTETLLQRYGFEQHPSNPDKWHHPDQTTNGFGTDVLDDGTWLTSSQTVQMLIGRSGGDAFDLYVAFGCDGDRDRAYRNICAYLTTGSTEPPGAWPWGAVLMCGSTNVTPGVVQ